MGMERINSYNSLIDDAKAFFEKNFQRIKAVFENKTLQTFIFEPFDALLSMSTPKMDSQIYHIITQVALINALIAAIPGKMGIGVFVSMAFEGWMAYSIARHVGIKFEKPSDVFQYFSTVAISIGAILWGFKALLSLAYSLFSFIPMINPLIIAEFITTNLVGVIFWVGFLEVAKDGSFTIPKSMLLGLLDKTKMIFQYQYEGIKSTFTRENIERFGNRFKSWINGDIAVDIKSYNGEIFAGAAMVYLMSQQYEKLQGPLGDMFLDAIRLRWSAQLGPDASVEEIAELFSHYSPEQLEGVINTIKGKMFELMVERAENMDNDSINATLFENESHPNTDIAFFNQATNETIEVSLKATNNPAIIEHALQKYPDTLIMTTDEIASSLKGNPLIVGSGISHQHVQEVTQENLDQLLDGVSPLDATHVIFGGMSVSIVAAIWPFTIAYMRQKISIESYKKAIEKIAPSLGVSMISRISYAFLLGPIFAWYLIARTVIIATKNDSSDKELPKIKYVSL